MRHIKVIGAGGIGTILLDNLCRYLNYYTPLITETSEISQDDLLFTITIIDGDTYEDRNRNRQTFTSLGNKAETKALEMLRKFENLEIYHISQYVNSVNINEIIEEGDIILLCVDNHDTRRLFAQKIARMDNVILISGGNGYETGDALTCIRKDGENLTPAITEYHPEIEEGDGQHPETLGCEQLHNVAPQLILANMGAAWLICCRFYKTCILAQMDDKICENNFDILTGQSLAKRYPSLS